MMITPLWKDIAVGADHPIIWNHCVGTGRAFYSALGHAASTYREPLHMAELGRRHRLGRRPLGIRVLELRT
jgi:type 1 glutamine amidotransferase